METDLTVLLQELVQSYKKMQDVVGNIDYLTTQTKLLSFNSSIEAARAGEAGKGFAVVSKEIKTMADESEKANKESMNIVKNIQKKINEVMAVRTADVASDIIDKIERNLFERFCDIQTWSTFVKFKECIENPNEQIQTEASELLKNLVDTYGVYKDLFLTDITGKLVAVGVHRDVLGKDYSNTTWFKDTMASKSVTVSDMYNSKSINAHTVAYSYPIKNTRGEIIGILSSRLDWKCVSDIIDATKVSTKGQVYVVNKNGIVIASKYKDDILRKDLSEHPAFKRLSGGENYGFLIEHTRTNNIITGFAHTSGHSTYKGKDWSVIVVETF